MPQRGAASFVEAPEVLCLIVCAQRWSEKLLASLIASLAYDPKRTEFLIDGFWSRFRGRIDSYAVADLDKLSCIPRWSRWIIHRGWFKATHRIGRVVCMHERQPQSSMAVQT